MHDPLTLLLDAQLITPDDAQTIATYLDVHGGSLLNAIASQPKLDVAALWSRLAVSQDRQFIPSVKDASPIDGSLITREDATRHLILGRVMRFQTVHVITPNPFLSTTDLLPLRDHLRDLTPGRRALIRIEVTTPSVWKTLYDYTYPITPYTPRMSLAEAVALASLTPLQEIEHMGLLELRDEKRITPEQYAEALARQEGVPYINLDLNPPDEDALNYVPTTVIRATRQYPWGFTRDGQIITVGDTIPTPETLEAFQRIVRLKPIPALISQPAHRTLMETLS